MEQAPTNFFVREIDLEYLADDCERVWRPLDVRTITDVIFVLKGEAAPGTTRYAVWEAEDCRLHHVVITVRIEQVRHASGYLLSGGAIHG